ncbi:hypothetical protein FB382_004410 [Nocardioides ginsengisegetis]|uniref:Uncharacterized protein n=1 Tax=Nocardioides ginsengisegetis TaxID=661491 RepID=A0A7W3J4A3_9ACTN|nr:hypothetical protein [Nocardioides ginsengisegetis]MBA8806030.1 hypothetical protein [Nocardioides ginsengisegetis]MBA8806058.1 hypothetical protein [Nocardioides ginsengisegetis]
MSIADTARRVGTIEREHLANKGRVEVTPEGGEFTDVQLDAPIKSGDWSRVFRIFQLDATEFEVVDDTVRMTTWQQSKALEDGTRDIVQLYSYGARFKRKPKARLSDDEITERRKAVAKWKIPKRERTTTRNGSVAAVINLADIQGGKSEGGGVAATQQRLHDGLENVDRWLDRMAGDYNVSEVVLVNNGDPMENCAGNYAAQLFTVELNHRGQMNFVLDVWEQYARHLFPRFDKARFVSVLCNHGEFGRMGAAKSQTSDSDNAGGFLAETLRRVLDRPEFAHVEWTIPHDEMNVYADVAGVPMAFNHGHKIPGNDASGFEKWLNGQVRGDHQAHAARIWQTAHRHHFAAWDMGSCSVFQAPSLDGGSKWLTDMTGRYSRSGILAYLVGEHAPLGWSDMAFL